MTETVEKFPEAARHQVAIRPDEAIFCGSGYRTFQCAATLGGTVLLGWPGQRWWDCRQMGNVVYRYHTSPTVKLPAVQSKSALKTSFLFQSKGNMQKHAHPTS